MSMQRSHFYSFDAVDLALSQLGFTERKKLAVYKLIASILHLGNIEVEENSDNNICNLKDASKIWLESSAELLQVDAETLKQALFYCHLESVNDNIKFDINFLLRLSI